MAHNQMHSYIQWYWTLKLVVLLFDNFKQQDLKVCNVKFDPLLTVLWFLPSRSLGVDYTNNYISQTYPLMDQW